MKPLPPELVDVVRLHIENSADLVSIITFRDGLFIYSNEQFSQMPIPPEQDDPVIMGKTVRDIGFYQTREERLKIVDDLNRTGYASVRNDFSMEGKRYATLHSMHLIAYKDVQYVVTTISNISNLFQTELQLSEALDRLEKAQTLGLIGDLIRDSGRDVYRLSAQAARIFGIPEATELKPTELATLVSEVDRPKVTVALDDVGRSGTIETELQLASTTPARKWILMRVSRERSAGTEATRITIQDITSRKRDSEERAELQQKMQESQRLESLGLLAGGIAHDFNNLLVSVMGNADLALLDSSLNPDTRARLSDIVLASKRAADMTRQLLGYAGKGRYVIEPINISTLIKEIADLLSISISKDHKLNLDLADDISAVEADVTQLRQLIMNLILNASEAIEHPDGVINVTTGNKVCDVRYLRQCGLEDELTPGKYAFIDVNDNGSGMSAETHARLFDPFFTTKFAGRGLGMAAARGIARGHNGAIQVHTEPGRGTTFRVLLPACEATPRLIRNVQPESAWQGSETILVIDDDETVRVVMVRTLEQLGYKVLTASSGIEGVQAFRH